MFSTNNIVNCNMFLYLLNSQSRFDADVTSGSSPTARPILPSPAPLTSFDQFRLPSINHLRWAFGPLTVLLLPFAHPLLSSLINRIAPPLRA